MSRMASALHQAKAALRKELKSRLAAMTEEERLRQSNSIAQKLFAMPKFESCQRVCLYLHMKEEVQTVFILKHLLAANKECFIPQYIGADMKMVKLTSWADYESLPETKWKIKQPADDDVRPDALDTDYKSLPETKWKIKQPADDDVRPDALDTGGLDMMLMPGLGFTLRGDRIGRGKGYYDTYLQKCQESGGMPVTVALAYTQQICDDIPVTDTDMTVDVVLSPD